MNKENQFLRMCRGLRLSVFFLLFVAHLTAQNQYNPFEIRSRLNVDSVEIQVEPVKKPVKKDTTIVKVPYEGSSANPFEVDHVPIRKKAVKDQNKARLKSEGGSKAFVYWVLLVTLLLLTIAVSGNRSLLGKNIKSVTNENILKFEHRNAQRYRLEAVLYYLIFVINLGVFILLVLSHFKVTPLKFSFLAYITAGVAVIYLLRHASYAALGSIFPLDKETALYNYTIQVFNSLLGIVLIPINLFLAFGSEGTAQITIFIGAGLFLLFLLMRYIRGFFISMHLLFNHLIIFFIYLCTLEIAPILVAVRIARNYMN